MQGTCSVCVATTTSPTPRPPFARHLAHHPTPRPPQVALGPGSALQYISHEFGSLPSFLRRFPNDLSLRRGANGEALVALLSTPQAPQLAEPPEMRVAEAELMEAEMLQAAEEGESGEDDGVVGLADEEEGEEGEEAEAEAEAKEEKSLGAALRLADDLTRQSKAQRAARSREQKAALREKLLLLLDKLVDEETPAYEQEEETEYGAVRSGGQPADLPAPVLADLAAEGELGDSSTQGKDVDGGDAAGGGGEKAEGL